MKKFCVGIDVDKRTFQVCLISLKEDLKRILGSKTFSNSLEGFIDFSEWVSKKASDQKVYFVMEATGVYHEYLAYHLHGHKGQVHIVLPLKSKRYIQSLGIRSKTDQIDAKGLAMMGLEQTLDIWQPGSKQLLELRSLTRQIEMLQEHRTAFKNQLEGAKHSAVMHKSVIKSLEQMIAQTGKQITKLEGQIKKIIECDPFLKRKYELLNPLKGVGIMSFAVVISETNGFALFKNQRQLVCYSGYDVLSNQSGQRVGKTRISKKGNTHIRRILHMAAWSAVENNSQPFRNLYDRVYERTGVKMKAYVAVQRKLLVMIYTLWKKDIPFDPDYGTSGNQEPKLLFSVGSKSQITKTAKSKDLAALDELPYNQSPEALFSVP